MRVPAPQMGNLDLPPDDGYTWRKYGQKEILGSKYPRYVIFHNHAFSVNFYVLIKCPNYTLQEISP